MIIMKKAITTLLSVFILCGIVSAADSKNTNTWNIVFQTNEESISYSGVEIHKNGKKLFSLSFENPYCIGFMIPLDSYKTTRQRFEYKGIYKTNEKTFKYQDYLVDIKGNGDKRYLIICNWGGGNGGPYDDGYLIDTKDNFSVIGRIPTAEIYDYPMPNPNLIFTFYEPVEYFSARAEVGLTVKKKLQKDKNLLVVPTAKDFSIEPYKKILADNNWADARAYAFGSLYCDLASNGLLKHLTKYARELGFTEKEITDGRKHYQEKIRKNKFYKYISLLNNIRK